MRKINLRQGLMLAATGIMVLMLVTVLVRMGTQRVLVNNAKLDNHFTQTMLTGTTYGLIPEDRGIKDKKIEWQKKYPFADIETTPQDNDKTRDEKGAQTANNTGTENTFWFMEKAKRIMAWPLNKVKRLVNLSKSKAKVANNILQKEKSTISIWSSTNLLGYNTMVETGRSYEVVVEWHLMNPDRKVVELEDGVWSFVYPELNHDAQVKAVCELNQWLKQRNIEFCYIVAPFKVDKYGDFCINGRLDFSNQSADKLLAGINSQGVTALDLRENFHTWAKNEGLNYHDFFFKTDHHWKPESALRAANVIGERLKTYGIPVEDGYLNLASFDVEVLHEFFLGSQGKKVTLAKTKAEDFSILHPKFPTQIHFVLPQKDIDITGPLDKVAYEYRNIARKDYYKLNPYAMYGYGDQQVIKMENLMLPETDKKVLIIKDSFSDTMGPLLAAGVRNVTMIDIRAFKASLRAYIEENCPDVVIVIYNAGNTGGKINWKAHNDKFDFR